MYKTGRTSNPNQEGEWVAVEYQDEMGVSPRIPPVIFNRSVHPFKIKTFLGSIT